MTSGELAKSSDQRGQQWQQCSSRALQVLLGSQTCATEHKSAPALHLYESVPVFPNMVFPADGISVGSRESGHLALSSC